MTDTFQFNQRITDEQGAEYLVVAKTDDDNVLIVTPTASNYGGMNYCIQHRIAYKNRESCELCRLQVVTHPIG